jgi:hypothetical protein
MIEAQVAIMQPGADDDPEYMIFLVKAGIDLVSANLDSAAAGISTTRPETRGSPDQERLAAVVNRSRNAGFTVRKCKLP